MVKILFVCHGNICRSPMAEFVMKDLLRKRGIEDEFYICSAATTSEEIWDGIGRPVYPPARRKLAEHGIGTPDNELGVGSKQARLLKKEDYTSYDYIIGMDSENLYDMKHICGGDRKHKISLLMDYTGRPRSVADPWYTGDFTATWNDIYEGCTALLQFLTEK